MNMLFRYFSNIFLILSYCDLFACKMLLHRRTNNYLRENVSTTAKLRGKIVGGTVVDIEAYPFAVQFINMGTICGGMILNSWTVITAAHCLEINTDTNFMMIQAGAKYLYDRNAEMYDIKSFVIHENFNKEQAFSCDIALVFVNRNIKLGRRAMKGILVNHDRWMDVQETNFVVTGWGLTKQDGAVSNSGLNMARLRYITRSTCSKLLNGHKLTKDMFCLYGDGERDTCQGDSGGGVLWNNMLVGLTSHGEGCATKGSPSVYTSLYVLRHWIKKHVYEFINGYCNEKFRLG